MPITQLTEIKVNKIAAVWSFLVLHPIRSANWDIVAIWNTPKLHQQEPPRTLGTSS